MTDQRNYHPAVTIETLPPFHIASYRSASSYPEADGAKYIEEWIAHARLPEPVRHFGFDVDVTPEEKAAGFRAYEFWIILPASYSPSEGLVAKEFEGGLYAVATLPKPFADPFDYIPKGWKDLHDWVVGSDTYRGASHQWLEEILPAEGGDDLKLYHPVVKI